MRRQFADELYKWMEKDKDIWLIVGDLGYKVFDKIKEDFPDRFINTGAAEQAMMGIGVGLALQGKKPFVYSITPFLLWRAAETIRLYVNHEQIPVRLVGSGRGKDYAHDGFSHDASDDWMFFWRAWTNINPVWPETKEEIPSIMEQLVTQDKPWYINLKR